MGIPRRKCKVIKVGRVSLGGSNPVAIQSMVKCATADTRNVVRQIKSLEALKCEIIRVAIKDFADARAIRAIKKEINIPLVADIHFDFRLALEAIEAGADKIRLNPGNISRKDEVREVAAAAKANGIPIRVGVNSGSVKSGNSVAALVKSALDYIKLLESFRFKDIVVSLKASNVLDTVEAYRKMAKLCDYPLHLGVTATGSPFAGAIKSSIAVGSLLLDGIGDTIRVSLTDTPEQEVIAAKIILESLGKRNFGPQIISCPTCGRCEVDLIKIVRELENKLSAIRYPLSAKRMKVAVMGCVVNGPGEAKEADIGVAFGKKEGLLFKKGKVVRKISANDCAEMLVKELRR